MRRCKHCGENEDEHCIFEPMPDQCVCDVGTWFGAKEITPICAQYIGSGDEYCANCSHDQKCHKEKDQ